VKPHGDNPQDHRENDNSQEIYIDRQVALVPGGEPRDISEVGKGRDIADGSRRFRQVTQRNKDAADEQERKLDKGAQHLGVLRAANRGNREK